MLLAVKERQAIWIRRSQLYNENFGHICIAQQLIYMNFGHCEVSLITFLDIYSTYNMMYI